MNHELNAELEFAREIRSKIAEALGAADERIAALDRDGAQPSDMEAEGYIYPEATIALLDRLSSLGEWADGQKSDVEYNPLVHAETIAGEPSN